MSAAIQYVLYMAVLVGLAIPLGGYMAKVMRGGAGVALPGAGPLRAGHL